jgi:heat shock protein HslJ
MKKVIYFILFLLFLTFTSCTKDVQTDDITGTWKLTELHPNKDVSREKDNVYTIQFDTDNSIKMQLDANDCWSTYELKDDNKILIGNFACTEVCCDTEYALEFLNIVTSATEISIRFGKMTLKGDKGKAELKRQ